MSTPIGSKPTLSTKEISDIYVRKNFENLQDYFNTQNQLQDFRFFDLVFTKATTNFLVSHGFAYIPQDIITTKVTGSGTVIFNYGLFDLTNINITVTAACRVRFFVGTYWNYLTTAIDTPAVYTAQAALPSAATLTPTGSGNVINPMTSSGDMIYGGVAGLPTRLPGGIAGYVLTSQGPTSAPVWAASPATVAPVGVYAYNFLVNSGFDYWQATTSIGVSTQTYGADQWYVNSASMTGGNAEFSQQTAGLNGSGFGMKVDVASSGSAGTPELYQVLSNKATRALYNQIASFSIQVKAAVNVTQVGVQFFYATTETKLTTAIGPEVLTTVNTSGFTPCTINGQALGTAMTTSGVVGVRIRVTAVSSGNIWTIGAGFIVEQAILNLGSTAGTWSRQYNDPAQELAACQYFYEKSYDPVSLPGTNTGSGSVVACTGKVPDAGGDNVPVYIPYKVTKRVAATFSYWDQPGNASKFSRIDASNTQTNNVSLSVSTSQAGVSGHYLVVVQTLSGTGVIFHFVADARI